MKQPSPGLKNFHASNNTSFNMNHLLQLFHCLPMSRLGQHDDTTPHLLFVALVHFWYLKSIQKLRTGGKHFIVEIFVNDTIRGTATLAFVARSKPHECTKVQTLS